MRKLFIFLIGAVALSKTEEEERCLWGDSYLKVKTSNGYVQGYLGESCRSGRQYAGFRGIPYAEPPIGELRFRAPLPRKSWEGVWNATYQRSSCIQSNPLDDQPLSPEENDFSEDCLYLNVYTPNVNYLKFGLTLIHPLKAVMVFIHPGAFNSGGSTEDVISPDFLIDQDVVLVTFNYRLGALGFLSFQNEEVPGNAGLKDQTLALRWVKENIRHFGGDPAKITIFGESAGSASVNYHILSKSSEGLFRNAIMQSGSAIASWAYSTPKLSLTKALKLARKVRCTQKDLSEVLKCMQKVPAKLITENQQKALTVEELLSLKIIAFHPTTEPDVPGAFLTTPPFDLLYYGNFTKVPVIIGSNMDEGLLVYPTLMKKDPNGYLLTLLGMDLSRFAPYSFHVKPFTKAAIKVHREISKFYFNSRILTRALMNDVLELLSDVMFTLPIQLTAGLMAESSVPVYNYLFTYDGGYNIAKAVMGILNVPGVCHGDDLGYLFYTRALHTECGRNGTSGSPDEITIDRLTKMWANFAKTGNPTPKPEPEIQCEWKTFTSTERNYLDIGQDLVPSDSLKLANMIFWENLVDKLMELNNSESPKEVIDNLEVSDLMSVD